MIWFHWWLWLWLEWFLGFHGLLALTWTGFGWLWWLWCWLCGWEKIENLWVTFFFPPRTPLVPLFSLLGGWGCNPAGIHCARSSFCWDKGLSKCRRPSIPFADVGRKLWFGSSEVSCCRVSSSFCKQTIRQKSGSMAKQRWLNTTHLPYRSNHWPLQDLTELP